MKRWLYERTLAELRGFGLDIVEAHSNPNTPWGAYIRISEESLPDFYHAYWQGIEVPEAGSGLRLDPKILLVAPGARLSLQYHHRRGEHWRVLEGPVQIILGDGPDSLRERVYVEGDVLRIPCGKWHRLVGLDSWGRIAEIWEHTDPENPSGEDDIVRVEDDFGR